MNINPRVPRKTGTRPLLTRTIRKILDITTITGNQNKKINTKTGSNIEDGAQNRTYTRIRPECKHRKITLKLYTKEASRVNRNKYQRFDNKFRAERIATR